MKIIMRKEESLINFDVPLRIAWAFVYKRVITLMNRKIHYSFYDNMILAY